MMTPREFAAKYTSMDVYIIPSDAPKDDPRMDPDNAELPPGKWETTNVSRYRLGLNNGYKDDFWRVVASKFYKGGAIQVVVKNIDGTIETRVYRSDKEIALAATSAFWGKGTPEEVQITLQLRYRFQKTTFKLADFVKAYFIGLDCNGFVGNYIWRVWNNNDWYRTSEVPLGPNVQITTLMQKAGTPVTKLEDLVADRNGIYIMALTIGNGTILEKVKADDGHMMIGHIMISQPGEMIATGKTIKCPVLESSGGNGLGESVYEFQSVKNGIFKVLRHGAVKDMRITKLTRTS